MPFDAIFSFQNIALYVFPTLVFMILFFLALGHVHLHTRNSEERKITVNHRFPENIEEKNAPFPIVLILIIAGAVIWSIFYIMAYGLYGVKL